MTWISDLLARIRFERAYVLVYTGQISVWAFPEESGIYDRREAFAQLRAYRERVMAG